MLIAAGHADPLGYSPRQAVAYAELAMKRRKRERLEDFRLMRAAMHGDQNTDKELEKAYGE